MLLERAGSISALPSEEGSVGESEAVQAEATAVNDSDQKVREPFFAVTLCEVLFDALGCISLPTFFSLT